MASAFDEGADEERPEAGARQSDVSAVRRRLVHAPCFFYGCNMAVRMDAVSRGGIRFDEKLPLYGWQEDVDFCRRLAPQGRIVWSPALRGVHLGSKRGRSPGLRLGYSQVANPPYLIGKGTVSRSWALRLIGRNIAANLLGSLRTQGLVDRRGRLRGNLVALRDMVLGRMSPDRILAI